MNRHVCQRFSVCVCVMLKEKERERERWKVCVVFEFRPIHQEENNHILIDSFSGCAQIVHFLAFR